MTDSSVSIPGNCQFIIDSTLGSDTSSWYEVWQAMVAINGMCTRYGKLGIAYALGKSRSTATVWVDPAYLTWLGSQRRLIVDLAGPTRALY